MVSSSNTSSFSNLTSRQVVDQFVQCFRENNLEGIRALCTPECDLDFSETPMPLREYLDEYRRIMLSFPDFTLECRGVKRVSGKPNKFCLEFLQASGTHTGEPYGFGPYPEVPTSNIKFRNDPERVIFTVDPARGNKVSNLLIIPSGEMTGPPGIYKQIGGFPIF